MASATPARADRFTIESEPVKQAVAAYNDLEYAKAVELCNKALLETLTRDEKIVTYQTLGFAHVALGHNDDAMAAFENLLRIDGAFELDRTISPRVRAIFEEARGHVATTEGTIDQRGLPAIKTTVTPAKKIKEGMTVGVAGAYPGGVAARVEMFYRRRGQQAYGKLTAPVTPAGSFTVDVPGMHVQAPALEYYLVVLDESGAALASAGALAQPLAVDVEGRKRPLYTKGWFWGVIGGVAVVGAGVATAVALSTRSTISASTPATISIMPH